MSVSTLSAKRIRQQLILELISKRAVHSQEELADLLAQRGYHVTQATVSRDVAELRLVKVPRGQEHVYVGPDELALRDAPAGDERLRRLLDTMPVTLGRSGLTLVLHGPVGTAQALARSIDQSSLQEQEGTLAGDDTVLVLFRDEDLLRRWQSRFRTLQGLPAEPER